MDILKKEIEKGKYKYLIELINYLEEAEKKADFKLLNSTHILLNQAVDLLEEQGVDEKSWRKDLLLNYFFNIEYNTYKLNNPDEEITKWSIFLEKVEESSVEELQDYVKELESYMPSQDAENVTFLTEEKMEELTLKFNQIILPVLESKLDNVDKYRAKLRLTQRLNLVKRKVPVNQNVSFGDWVKAKRTAKGLSLSKLAEKSGYSSAYIFRIEKGTRQNPTPQVISSIVSALGYKPEDYLDLLFNNEEDNDSLKSVELSDLLELSNYKINGEEVSPTKRNLLLEVFKLINDEEVLRVPKINELKSKIKEYQESK